MAFTVEYRSSAPAEVVLHAIRQEAAYWRESLVPDQLRAKGVYGVAAEVRAPHFRLYCEHNRRPPPTLFELRGTVTSSSEGGSRVLAHGGIARGFLVGPALFAALGIWVLASGGTGGVALIVLAALVGGVQVAHHHGVTPTSDAGARHLIERLDRALVPPGASDAQPSPTRLTPR